MFWQRIKIQIWEQRKKRKEAHILTGTEHDWIASQEMGSTILRETENLWTPMKRFLHKRRKPKWGDWDGLYIEEEDL